MARNESETGTLVIPADQWPAFKREFRDTYNAMLAADLVVIEGALARVKTECKGKRNVAWTDVVAQALEARRATLQLLDPLDVAWRVVARERTTEGQERQSLKALKSKDFPPATTKTLRFDFAGASVTFNDAERTVCWNVPENKAACSRARESKMGRVFFRQLTSVRWGRNSGGTIAGSDEYHRDANQGCVGGGGNYVTGIFGPLGERAAGFSFSAPKKSGGFRTAKR